MALTLECAAELLEKGEAIVAVAAPRGWEYVDFWSVYQSEDYDGVELIVIEPYTDAAAYIIAAAEEAR